MLGADLAVLGVLGRVGRGFGSARRAGLGWAWGLAVLGFGSARRAGLGWAWDLVVQGVGWA